MRLVFVCRYFPPDGAPTGKAVAEIGAALKQLFPSLEIFAATTDGYYAETPALAEAKIPAVRLRAFPRTTKSLSRLIFSLIEGRRLVRRALATADIVVTISDPPLCELWMKRRTGGQYWVHWPMDLYPEVFEAAGLAKPESLPLRWLTARLRRILPDLMLAISPFQARLLEKRGTGCELVILPCGVKDEPLASARPSDGGDLLTLVCCGNAGQGFASRFLLQIAERLDPECHRLLVSLRGTRAPEIRQKLLAHAPAAEWHDWLPEETLAAASAHIVAQLPSWAGVSVPSRAVTALTLARPLIAAGATGSDLDSWGRRAGWFFSLSDDGEADGTTLAGFLATMTPEALAVAAKGAALVAEELRRQRQEGVLRLAQWIAARTGLPLEGPVIDRFRQDQGAPDGFYVSDEPVHPAEPSEIVG